LKQISAAVEGSVGRRPLLCSWSSRSVAYDVSYNTWNTVCLALHDWLLGTWRLLSLYGPIYIYF